MKLTDAEKLTLTMIGEIHSSLNLANTGIDSNLVTSAIDSGNTWAISWQYGDVLDFHDREVPPAVKDVTNVLDMWNFIEEAYEELTPAEKEELEERAAPFGKNVRFPGFDGNNETNYFSIVRFFVNKMGLFQRYAGRDLNSHAPSMAKYLRMYEIFEPWRDNWPNRPLNVDELVELLAVRASR